MVSNEGKIGIPFGFLWTKFSHVYFLFVRLFVWLRFRKKYVNVEASYSKDQFRSLSVLPAFFFMKKKFWSQNNYSRYLKQTQNVENFLLRLLILFHSSWLKKLNLHCRILRPEWLFFRQLLTTKLLCLVLKGRSSLTFKA